MKRRRFIQSGLAVGLGTPLLAALQPGRLNEAVEALAKATQAGTISSAVLYVVQRESAFSRVFGRAQNEDAMFLLGSISKPICMTALMTLYDQGEFKLNDRLKKFIPRFTGDRRDEVTLQQLLTHLSGLPDQLPENDELRRNHATISQFVEGAIRTRLLFTPGSKYLYSSMAILLAARVAEIISQMEIRALVERVVFHPLKMQHSAQGLGDFQLEGMVPVQTDHAAPESGGGDPKAKHWDWNSAWWRKLGAPWGGTHASAPDIARFLAEFLSESGACVKPETARLMVRNQNPDGLTSRGLGFAVGTFGGCSEKAFGHTGSTGTIAWADPATHTVSVVLTSLPAAAVQPHPRDLAAQAIAASVR